MASTAEAPTSMVTVTTPEDEVREFISAHVWVAILGTLALLCLAVIASFAIYRLRRRRSLRRHGDYQPLNDDWSLTSKVELQKRRVKVAQRDTALLNCSFFLRSSGEYTLLDHLPELGQQENKQWFLVRHRSSRGECVLTVSPKPTAMVLPFNSNTERAIGELVLTLQHPYILPLTELAFQMDVEHVVTIYPYNRAGSLRDHIYTARCIDSYTMKYGDKGQGLELPTVKLYGKQVLQGLLFLKEKGFPFFGHLHSGNVIVEDNTCRLCGFENTLLSVPPKLGQLLRRYARSDMRHFDVLSFGHLLYEMVTGFELDTAVPESRHYVLIQKPQVIEILQYIFNNSSSEYPSIKKISQHVFFKHVTLRELEAFTPVQIPQPAHVKSLLRSVKKAHPVKRKSVSGRVRAGSMMSQTGSMISQTSLSSGSIGSGSSQNKSSQRGVPLTPVLSDTDQTQTDHSRTDHSQTDHSQTEQPLRTRPYPPPKPAGISPPKRKSPGSAKRQDSGSPGQPALQRQGSGTPGQTTQRQGSHNPARQGSRSEESTERTALLTDIRRGVSLKKTGSNPRV